MRIALTVLLDTVRSTVELGLFVLLPIMVVMLAAMKVLQSRGVLDFVARMLSPSLRIFGISGLSVIAALQQLFVSFAAPPTTLAVMVRMKAPAREIAATLAMVLAMSQANATFPMTALGLNIGVTWLTSVLGGLTAAALTYYVLFKPPKEETQATDVDSAPIETERRGVFQTAFDGALEGFRLVLKSMPVILVAILVVNTAEAIGVLSLLESNLAPALNWIGLPGIAIVPVVTKYVAGGTAMMGVTLDLVRDGTLSVSALNRISGFTINPLDVVGLAVLAPAVAGTPGVLRPAILGAVVGILVRGVLHLLIF